jgi:general secretion pathway protein A
MSQAFYGFAHSPFTLAPDPRFLYLGPSHRDALERLLQSVRQKAGLTLLTGERGTGKTTLCRALVERLDPATCSALLLDPFLSVEELLQEMLLDFGVVSRSAVLSGRLAAEGPGALVRALAGFLEPLPDIGGTAVLILDEAHQLGADAIEQVARLAELEAGGAPLLQIVMAGQLTGGVPGLAPTGRLGGRAAAQASLRPLDRDEVDAYLAHRLEVAGGTHVRFERTAVDLTESLTRGIPRAVNLLADRALALGAEASAASIGPALVQAAARQLGMKRPPAAVRWWRRLRATASSASRAV